MKIDNKLILFLTVFIDMMGFSVIFPLFPETLKFYFNRGNDPLLNFFISFLENYFINSESPFFIVLFGGLIGSIYAVLQFIFAPVWGKLSDTFGRKIVLEFTSLGSLIGYITWFFSGNFTSFVFSRVITGTMGGNISVASASMADMTDSKNRAKGMGMIGAGIGLGFIFGPPLGGILSRYDLNNYFPFLNQIGTTNYTFSALVSVLVALINFILIFMFFKETLLVSNQRLRSFSHPVFGIFKSKSKNLPYISLIYFLFTLGFSGFEFCVNFFFNEKLGFTPGEIGLSFLYMGSIVIFVQGGVVRKISGKVTEKKISLGGSIHLIIGFLILSLADSTISVFVSLFFLSFGSALVNPGVSSLASLNSSEEDQGLNLGILRGFGSLARVFAPLSFSVIYFTYGVKICFYTSLVIVILVFLFLLKYKEGNRSDRI